MEQAKLAVLKGELESLIDASPTLKQFKSQLLLDLTSEGLRIQIVDEKNRPMFDSASSEVKPYTRLILREIGKTLNEVENLSVYLAIRMPSLLPVKRVTPATGNFH